MNRKLLLTLHRLNGYLITLLAFVHPALIKASENFTPYTFEKKYFPEFVGISLLLLTLTVSIPALFRRHIGISASRWLSLHRFGATLTLAILPLHVLRVSDTFKGGLPYSAALVIFGLNGLFLLRIWFRRVFRH